MPKCFSAWRFLRDIHCALLHQWSRDIAITQIFVNPVMTFHHVCGIINAGKNLDSKGVKYCVYYTPLSANKWIWQKQNKYNNLHEKDRLRHEKKTTDTMDLYSVGNHIFRYCCVCHRRPVYTSYQYISGNGYIAAN